MRSIIKIILAGALAALMLTLPARALPADPPDPAELLAEGFLSCHESIDLSACGLPVSELGRIYADLLHSRPELFHVAPRLSFTSREPGAGASASRVVEAVYPVYTLTGEALTAARTLYRDTVTALLHEMDLTFGGASPTEAETVLYIHDLLADRYAYDIRADAPDTSAEANTDAYTLFRDGRGVCQAYALAFIALARGAGLEADFVASEVMNHAWNHVRVDGVWYHVDVTRDDPIPASPGSEQVNHTRLLRSDEGMNSLGYRGYACTAGHACTDARFESEGEAALAGFSSALTVTDGGWLGTTSEGAPAAVTVGKEGISTGIPGDMDGDQAVTPADLLMVYDQSLPDTWRDWIRRELVRIPAKTEQG